MKDLIQCHKCKGTKKVTIKHYLNGKLEGSFETECFTCKGTGQITQKQKDAEDNFWCRCKKSSGSLYVPDSADSKHHWVCEDCGNVTQVG